MANEWEIKSRGKSCSVTGRDFAEGEVFHTLLYREPDNTFRREDLCEEAWQERRKAFLSGAEPAPFSSWKTRYEPPPPPPPESLGKQTAEALLRKYMDEPGREKANARYILALMLERKKILKPVETKVENGERYLIYEHRETGEAFVILDPMLRLDQLDAVQQEVAALLA